MHTQIQEHKVKVKGPASHPLSRVPEALDSLRKKAHRARIMHTDQALMAAIKVQAMYRGKNDRMRLRKATTRTLGLDHVAEAAKVFNAPHQQ